MNNDTESKINLGSQIKPLGDGNWDSSVGAMKNYLTLLKKHAEIKTEKAQETLEEHQEDMDALKKSRAKQRNYGTRTGIVLDNGTHTNSEL